MQPAVKPKKLAAILAIIYLLIGGALAYRANASSDRNVMLRVQCESVVLGEYLGYQEKKIMGFRTRVASFRPVVILKGPPFGKDIRIKFELQNNDNASNSGRTEPHPSKMPSKGSYWILLVRQAVPVDGVYETLDGAHGLLPYSGEGLTELLQEIEARGARYQRSDAAKVKQALRNHIGVWNRLCTEASKYIVVAEYRGQSKITPANVSDAPPPAFFRVLAQLKGAPLKSSELRVKCYVHEGNVDQCKLVEPDKPAMGSKWILFFHRTSPRKGVWDTFHGADGRVECNRKNLRDVLYALSSTPNIGSELNFRKKIEADADRWYDLIALAPIV